MASCSYERIKQQENTLSLEAEKNLIRAAAMGISEAQEALISYNAGTINYYAYHFASSYGIPYEDLYQEAVIGLLKATEKYNPELDFRFSTYVRLYIKRALEDLVQIMGYDFSVAKSSEVYRRLQKARYVYRELSADSKRKPSLEEFAASMDMSENDALSLLTTIGGCVRLNAKIKNDNDSKDVESFLTSTEQSVEDQVMALDLAERLTSILHKILTPKQLFIICHFFGLPGYEKMSLSEIARLWHVTHQNVDLYYKKALTKLRLYYETKRLSSYLDYPKKGEEQLKNFSDSYYQSLNRSTRNR